MSKLPVVSAAQCIRALEKIGFVVYRQRGSHLTLVRTTPPAQTTSRIIRNSIAALCAQSSGKRD
jgi:predicted RNA binding protein YcfA (HicA-like mRNA interferase family)